MKINISSFTSYLNQPCDRCGSKKRIAKTWKENIETFTGKKSVVEYSQIVCVNTPCQAAFDKKLFNETKKREEMKKKKEESDKKRKNNSLAMAAKTRLEKKLAKIFK
jgi:Fe-S oxidoreductase